MATGLHDTESFTEATIDESRTDPQVVVSPEAEPIHADVSGTDVMQVVLDLCDENSINRTLDVAELPTFAEEGFEVHQIDLAPNAGALMLREQNLREAQDWAALAQLLIERAEQTRNASDAAELLVEAATLYKTNLESLTGAHAILQKAIEIDPSHMHAVEELEALTEQTGEWGDLVQSFTESAERLRCDEPSSAGELRIRLACARAHGLRDLVGAFAELARVEDAVPSRVEPYLDALERMVRGLAQLESMIAVSHRIGDHKRTARLMSRAIAMSQSVVQRSEYHHRIAQIELERDEDEAAVWHWNEAIRLDPRRNDARDALAALHTERGEFRNAASLLEEARACSTTEEAKAKYACDAAKIYSDKLGENTRAVDLFAVALQARPGHQAASMPVIERYFEQERWNELEAVLEPLLTSDYTDTLAPQHRRELFRKAALCASALAKHERALEHYQAVLALDNNCLESLEGSAKCLLALRRFPEAVEVAQQAIAQRGVGDDSTSIEMIAVCASAHRSLGQQGRAIALYERCAAHEHAESMLALAELHGLRGDFHKAVAMQLRIAETAAPDDRIELLCSVSDTLATEIGDLEAAIDLCWQALSLRSESRPALHRLAVLYTKNEQWRDAIKTIVRMAGLETSGLRRGRYLQAAGAIARRQNQVTEAVALLNRAMDSYLAHTMMSTNAEIRSACFACFDDILKLLEGADDWRGVERNYRQMICRLEPGDPDVGRLWSGLGHVYREKLGETDAAIDSFEVASSLAGASLTTHRILVDLYEGAGADQLDKAIERRRLLLEAEPHNPEHYKALRGLYVRTRQMDRVWCVCRALETMDAAEHRETAFFRRNQPTEMQWPTRPLNSEMWSRLRDSRVDPNISRIFGLVGELIAQQCTQPSALAKLSEQRGSHFDQLRQLFSATSYAYGLPRFDCIVGDKLSQPVALLNLRRGSGLVPTFALGESLYRGRTVPQIASGLGRVLALGRRSYYLRLALTDPAELAAAFYAGLSLAHPPTSIPQGLAVRVEAFRDVLARDLPPSWRRKLQDAGNAFLQGGARFDLDTWCRGADATAHHAALLLSGDLEFGIAAIRKEHGANSQVRDKESLALRVASVSEAHMSLREELGMQVADARD